MFKRAIKVLKREIKAIEKHLKHGIKRYGIYDIGVQADVGKIAELLKAAEVLEREVGLFEQLNESKRQMRNVILNDGFNL